MKILFISNLYPPNVFGGYERLCYDVASVLQARGHEVTVLTSSYGKNNKESYSHAVRRELFLFATEGNIYMPFDCSSSQRAEYEAINREKFEAVVADVKPDILFVWNLYFFDQGLLKAIESSTLPKTYLLTDNWMIAQLNSNFIGNYFSQKVFGNISNKNRTLLTLKQMARQILQKFTRGSFVINGRAIFPSRFMRQLYRDAGFRFQGGEAICYHGVRFLHSPEVKRKPRSELSSPSEVKMLFAGRVVNLKGVHTAIEAVHEVQKHYANKRALLTIVGDTQDLSYFGELESLIDSLGMRDSILFLPAVAEDKLFDLFQQHDIYLFPSLYEPFSLTLILALESGIPTIASDAGGNVEIVHNGKTGLIFRAGDGVDLASKIYSLAENGTLRDKISRTAVAHAAEFTFDNMISRVEMDLEKAVK
jgi:glycosyltransferase involved in cell wall biosynthesis